MLGVWGQVFNLRGWYLHACAFVKRTTYVPRCAWSVVFSKCSHDQCEREHCCCCGLGSFDNPLPPEQLDHNLTTPFIIMCHSPVLCKLVGISGDYVNFSLHTHNFSLQISLGEMCSKISLLFYSPIPKK